MSYRAGTASLAERTFVCHDEGRFMQTLETVNQNGIDADKNAAEKEPPSVQYQPKNHWGSLLKFALFSILFWLAEFSMQYFRFIQGELKVSILRSFALTGATFIGLALFSSSVFKWRPRLAVYWRIRRYLGVSGFIFGALHTWSVYDFLYDYDFSAIYWSFNPFKNPVIFASVAFPILFVMAITSTDWAVNKLTPKVWKFIHRFVYLAYWGIVFHFLLINPAILKNAAGYLLLAVTAAALLGELFWFIKIAGKKRFLTIGGAVGFAVIALYLIAGWLAIRAGLWF